MQEATRHDSLTAQLRELDSLQEARVREEEEGRLKAAEEARRREAESARLRAEQADEARRAEAAARAREEQERREAEEQRLRAEREAALRVQLEAERESKVAEQERELEHSRQMAAIHAVERRKLRNKRIAIGGLITILLAAAGGYVFGVQPAIERKAREAELARQAQELAVGEKQRAQQQLLEEQHRAAEAERAKVELERRIAAQDQRRREREARLKAKPGARATKGKKKSADCAPDDPLCGLKID
ncbi:MAG: hypothetical protein AAF500_07370 [Myxococcota bacterium]